MLKMNMCYRTAEVILSAVQTTISNNNATNVTIVGHSLGMYSPPLEGATL